MLSQAPRHECGCPCCRSEMERGGGGGPSVRLMFSQRWDPGSDHAGGVQEQSPQPPAGWSPTIQFPKLDGGSHESTPRNLFSPNVLRGSPSRSGSFGPRDSSGAVASTSPMHPVAPVAEESAGSGSSGGAAVPEVAVSGAAPPHPDEGGGAPDTEGPAAAPADGSQRSIHTASRAAESGAGSAQTPRMYPDSPEAGLALTLVPTNSSSETRALSDTSSVMFFDAHDAVVRKPLGGGPEEFGMDDDVDDSSRRTSREGFDLRFSYPDSALLEGRGGRRSTDAGRSALFGGSATDGEGGAQKAGAGGGQDGGRRSGARGRRVRWKPFESELGPGGVERRVVEEEMAPESHGLKRETAEWTPGGRTFREGDLPPMELIDLPISYPEDADMQGEDADAQGEDADVQPDDSSPPRSTVAVPAAEAEGDKDVQDVGWQAGQGEQLSEAGSAAGGSVGELLQGGLAAFDGSEPDLSPEEDQLAERLMSGGVDGIGGDDVPVPGERPTGVVRGRTFREGGLPPMELDMPFWYPEDVIPEGDEGESPRANHADAPADAEEVASPDAASSFGSGEERGDDTWKSFAGEEGLEELMAEDGEGEGEECVEAPRSGGEEAMVSGRGLGYVPGGRTFREGGLPPMELDMPFSFSEDTIPEGDEGESPGVSESGAQVDEASPRSAASAGGAGARSRHTWTPFVGGQDDVELLMEEAGEGPAVADEPRGGRDPAARSWEPGYAPGGRTFREGGLPPMELDLPISYAEDMSPDEEEGEMQDAGGMGGQVGAGDAGMHASAQRGSGDSAAGATVAGDPSAAEVVTDDGGEHVMGPPNERGTEPVTGGRTFREGGLPSMGSREAEDVSGRGDAGSDARAAAAAGAAAESTEGQGERALQRQLEGYVRELAQTLDARVNAAGALPGAGSWFRPKEGQGVAARAGGPDGEPGAAAMLRQESVGSTGGAAAGVHSPSASITLSGGLGGSDRLEAADAPAESDASVFGARQGAEEGEEVTSVPRAGAASAPWPGRGIGGAAARRTAGSTDGVLEGEVSAARCACCGHGGRCACAASCSRTTEGLVGICVYQGRQPSCPVFVVVRAHLCLRRLPQGGGGAHSPPLACAHSTAAHRPSAACMHTTHPRESCQNRRHAARRRSGTGPAPAFSLAAVTEYCLQDADAPARRRHVFLSPPKPSTPDPPASDTSEGGRALPPTRMMAANASPGSAASTSREPRAAAVEASAESSAPGDGDQGAEQAATDEQRVVRPSRPCTVSCRVPHACSRSENCTWSALVLDAVVTADGVTSPGVVGHL